MAIIYVNITELENCKTTGIALSGNTDEEKVQEVIEFYEKRRGIMLHGTVVTSYDKILEEIKNQIDYDNMSDYEYWNMKTNKDYIVFMLNDDMVLSYDYFLVRNNEIDEYYKYDKYNNKSFNFKIIYRHCYSNKLIKEEMIEDIILLERGKISDISDEKNRIKKILFTDGTGVTKKLNTVFSIDERKISQENKYDYYKIIFLFYYLDKHGIPQNDGKTYKKIKIFDNILKPNIQMVPDYLIYNYFPDSSKGNDLLKNEILKHLSMNQIREINKIYSQVPQCYISTFKYISNILSNPNNHIIEERELLYIENRIDVCNEILDNVKQVEKNEKYLDSPWELIYHRYKGYIFNCERKESAKSLRYAIKLGKPSSPMLFDRVRGEEKYGNISRNQIVEFLKKNAKWLASIVSNECTERWIKDHCESIERACFLMEEFNREYEFDVYPLTIVVSAAQSVYEVQKRKLKYENRNKKYKGNKTVSLYSNLKKMDTITGKVSSFRYVWVAIIKRWCNYNEGIYTLWEQYFTRIDLKFTELMQKIVSLNSTYDIDLLINGVSVEISLPKERRIFEIKESVEDDIQKLNTGYSLEILDLRVLKLFEHTNKQEEFINMMNEVIRFNDQHYLDNIFEFHLNMQYVSLKFKQDKLKKKLYLIDMRYLIQGNQYDAFRRSIELGLPWFTYDFTDF